MKRKSIAIITLGCLLCCMLAACGSGAGFSADGKEHAGVGTDGAGITAETAEESEEKAEPGAEESPDYEGQLRLFAAHKELWLEEWEESRWFCIVTDLDHNGRLELITYREGGEEEPERSRMYEIDASAEGVIECEYGMEEDDRTCWIDLDTRWVETCADEEGDWYYIYESSPQMREGLCQWEKKALRLKDGRVETQLIASVCDEEGEDGGWSRSYYDADHRLLSREADYELAEVRLFGWDMGAMYLKWMRGDELRGGMTEYMLYQKLREACMVSLEEEREADGIGSAPTAQTTAQALSYEEQLQILADHSARWLIKEDLHAQYAVADLNHNGRLEVISSWQQGTGRYSTNSFYEVNATFDGVEELTLWNRWSESEPDLAGTTWAESFYDEEEDAYYYLFTDMINGGAGYWDLITLATVLKGAMVRTLPIAYESREPAGAGEQITYLDQRGGEIGKEEYESAAEHYFDGCRKGLVRLGWFEVEKDTVLLSNLRKILVDSLRKSLEDSSLSFEPFLQEFEQEYQLPLQPMPKEVLREVYANRYRRLQWAGTGRDGEGLRESSGLTQREYIFYENQFREDQMNYHGQAYYSAAGELGEISEHMGIRWWDEEKEAWRDQDELAGEAEVLFVLYHKDKQLVSRTFLLTEQGLYEYEEGCLYRMEEFYELYRYNDEEGYQWTQLTMRGDALSDEKRQDFLSRYGMEEEPPIYLHYDENGCVDLELYYDKRTGKGCGFQNIWLSREPEFIGFAFSRTEQLEDMGETDRQMLFSDPLFIDSEEYAGHVDKGYREEYEYDEEGRITHFACFGRLEEATDDPNEEEEYRLVSMNFTYYDNGTVQKKDYSHYTLGALNFGTNRSSYHSYYDEQGRLLYCESYVTSGDMCDYLIYEGEEKEPAYDLNLWSGGFGLSFYKLK